MEHVNHFLDYIWTHPDAIIWYRASDMILNVDSDALYFSAPKACSCAGGYFFLGSIPRDGDPISDALYLSAPKACSRAGGYFFLGSIPQDGDPIKLNGAIHITCTILKLVAASAAEAELGALFLNTQKS